jgi:tetratricopeptide (TPR) repeat protein
MKTADKFYIILILLVSCIGSALTSCSKPVTVLAESQTAEDYCTQGWKKYQLGQKQQAILDYNKSIAINPNYARAYNDRGIAEHDLGQYRQAIDDYNKAIAINPSFAWAYNNRGISKSSIGQKQQAIIDYNKAISIDPKFDKAYDNRAIVESELGQKTKAIVDHNQAISISPNFTGFYISRAYTKQTLGRNREAIADYDKAISLDSKFTFACKKPNLIDLQRKFRSSICPQVYRHQQLDRAHRNIKTAVDTGLFMGGLNILPLLILIFNLAYAAKTNWLGIGSIEIGISIIFSCTLGIRRHSSIATTAS